MWQRFTERARKVIFFAQEEAGRFGVNHVSTEHLLLGLVRENETLLPKFLTNWVFHPGEFDQRLSRRSLMAKVGPAKTCTLPGAQR